MGRPLMNNTIVSEKKMSQWTPEEKKETSSLYGCEILFERATLAQVKDRSLSPMMLTLFFIV